MEYIIQETQPVWLVMSNTDLTEGRGFQFVKNVCQIKETATRLGKKQYVQGSNCPIEKSIALKVNNTWFVPGKIESPTLIDEKLHKIQTKVDKIVDKAKKLGLSTEEIEVMKGLK